MSGLNLFYLIVKLTEVLEPLEEPVLPGVLEPPWVLEPLEEPVLPWVSEPLEVSQSPERPRT